MSRSRPQKVLIIGSGPIVIGQAAEFDYSGTQACVACREAGVSSVLVNSNPATIQTDPRVADAVYLEPLTVDSLEQIIAREKPDGLIATVGGQTALNLAVALEEAGVLRRHGVRLLGTGFEAIQRGEDRALFSEILQASGQPILPSVAVTSIDEALAAAASLGYPVMCRSAFALGGAGSGFAGDAEELRHQVAAGLRASGSGQVLVERSVYGWTEVEYEVIRDAAGNALIVCNMENVDPMGVHTGDSIVVAPSQTLSDQEYHLLRRAALEVVAALGVEGACNVQFALNRVGESSHPPASGGRYYVIEVNPRLSRSSALASKATGYPIAKVATRIALGQTLPEIRNDITGTSAFFEPALDYVVVKIPRWPFDKFTSLPETISTRMRSTGEVMAIGRTCEEALDKAIRSLDSHPSVQRETIVGTAVCRRASEGLLREPSAARLSAMLAALDAGWSPQRIADLTRIHPWFLDRLAAVRGTFSSSGRRPSEGDSYVYKMVDTCAGEFEARTPYFYGTSVVGGVNEANSLPGPKAVILGSGPIRIGQGVEFDYATVHACQALSDAGVRSIIVNNNPETVSTDYSTSDRLYFEPLDLEAVLAVVRNEADHGEAADSDDRKAAATGLLGIIPQFGGQTAINLVGPLHEAGVRILGTPPEFIDAAEDRTQATALLTDAGIPTPAWLGVERWEDLPAAVQVVGYPLLLRPSYVLSGRGMVVAHGPEDVERYIEEHGHTPLIRPLLVDHFLSGARELNVDAVSDGEDVVMVIVEQFEECGVHSGDSAEVYPVQTLEARVVATVEAYTRRLAHLFHIVGLMNVQYAVQGDNVYVLEINPRASRSVPFASKASGLPLTDLAIRCILGERLADLHVPAPHRDRVSVKEVVLPFRVFPALPPVLGPEMQSTGESMGSARAFAGAYWKAQLGAGWPHLPFGLPVYLSLPDTSSEVVQRLAENLQSFECSVILATGTGPDLPLPHRSPAEAGSECGLVVVLGRTIPELDLLHNAVEMGVPYITTSGGLRGLSLALAEGEPDMTPMEPLAYATS